MISRFGVSLDSELLRDFDRLIARKGYRNRSEAIRDLIRESLVQEEWRGEGPVVGVVTIVYSHDKREIVDALTDLQHLYYENIVSSMHVHLDEENCLEVIIVRGRAGDVRTLADRLMSTKGIKHGRFIATTTGKGLR